MAKPGTNFNDRNMIREYVEAGNTNADSIGRNLGVATASVQGCINNILAEKAPTTKPVQLDLAEETPEPASEVSEKKPRRRKPATA